jgi:MarR family 2-MHQ and catechol resistance regulon transcriptional repressor
VVVGLDATRATEEWDAYGLVLRAARALRARVEQRLATSGLTSTQFGVLDAIWHHGSLSQRELSRQVLTSPGNMTDVIDGLEERDLVRRTRQRSDRRAIQVELTEAGKALIGPLFAQRVSDVAAAMAALTAQELRELTALLTKLL